ncbi:beta-L-arabinofuranosidase domain-containing protein [Thermogutta sp.]|uniref:beta-L-arabinofuranosidase domain-containing protein n=1 Tax=Thermogutta sp. TaxID=1962930 RepID=UPI00321F9A0B
MKLTTLWRIFFVLSAVILPFTCAGVGIGEDRMTTEYDVIDRPPTELGIHHYPANRPPLLPSPLVKLPVGAVRAEGWLKTQLQLEADGFIGHLHELSRFLAPDGNAWLDPHGEGDRSFWEEVPYWLKGYGDLAYLLERPEMIAEARRWIEPTLQGQREDGWLGPRRNLEMINSPRGKKPDVWPNMIMLHVLQSYYEYTHDERVIEAMRKYFQWELQQPDEDFLLPYWQAMRASDNLVSVYWLYNLTGDKFLLELAQKIHRCGARWDQGVINWHGVNIAQGFRAPGIYYQQAGDRALLQRAYDNYREVRERYGQVPGGLYGADENCRPGYSDPRQAAETCAMVEMMYSCELLVRISGDPLWADRCEDVAFNSLPASMTPDLKALRYLTSPNLAVSDASNKAPGIENSGPMFLFDPYGHRCCQHNVSHGWPYFTEHLWMAAPGDGLAAVLYAPSRVKARVGKTGVEVQILEETLYPFDGTLQFTLESPEPVAFPLYLRIPTWCREAVVRVRSGKQDEAFRYSASEGGRWIVLRRTWESGDKVILELKRHVSITRWEKNHESVSVNYGPLTFSLKFSERYVRRGGTERWPAWEIYPENEWNYGLVLDSENPEGSFVAISQPWDGVSQPFTPEAAPIVIKAKGRKIPQWKLDEFGLVAPLQPSPVRGEGPIVDLDLIPMGCGRLRISAFPVIGEGPNAVIWKEPRKPPHEASHCFSGDTVAALSDGLEPKHSFDQDIPRFTWWPHRGTEEWVTYEFDTPRQVSNVAVYWYDDTGHGQCRVPERCLVEWWDGKNWQPVKPQAQCGVEKDRYNELVFDPVKTNRLRLLVKLRPGFSAGILEWKVN